MIYTKDELTQIEKLASVFTPVSVIAEIINVLPETLRSDIADRATDASAAYRRGKNATLVKIRAQEAQLALVGSPLAIENMNRNLIDMEDDE